ncbi:hypothetical protein PACTADRAFT_33788 [Pachysolen tannophilus NRRL Y-2460]|uniref:Carbohydrate kinase FGGY C-terminal domain-containing protein n=1 Tax=Pachysolen tannophilus NRRL Y-2460 TaxID=669874 RepID=A0A1E4TU05_PACTA|nr:hypothetical protein PACTADRAFT_33788 [Pachysolen tannophilus NRRL Y-2460]
MEGEMMGDQWFIGVDVGTGSARACVSDNLGKVLAVSERPISGINHPKHFEFITQSSTEIWEAVKEAVKEAIRDSISCVEGPVGVISGIGFAATCSLVVLQVQEDEGKLVPYAVDFEFQNKDQNIVLWMDHRCDKETDEINDACKDDPILNYIGGGFLPEMAIPKLKYLIDHIPAKDLEKILFMEFHDYLSIKAACDDDLTLYYKISNFDDGYDNYSNTSTKIKMALDGSLKGWSKDYFQKFGLAKLYENNFQLIGRLGPKSDNLNYLPLPYAGSKIGKVCPSIASQLGIPETTVIGHGVIDCYAGWISTVCAKDLSNTLSMVAGTSTCFLIAHNIDSFIPGIWGPFSGLIKDYYISEGGQSATGGLIEHLFNSHPAYNELIKLSTLENKNVYQFLDDYLNLLAKEQNLPTVHYLTKHMFLYGDILGNRTPYNNPQMRGSFIGESNDLSIKNLALKYLCILEFISFETKQIIETLEKGSHKIDKISISGSQSQNVKFVQMLSLITSKPVIIGNNPKYTVVRGASLIGNAAYQGKDIKDVMKELNVSGKVLNYSDNGILKQFLDTKYQIMVDMAESQIRYRKLIETTLNS